MATREIEQKIANGCEHRWRPIWWKPEGWLYRAIATSEHEKKFLLLGYRKAYRCERPCGLAYLYKTGAVVVLQD